MQQTLEKMLEARGTRRWIGQIFGAWPIDRIIVQTSPKHILPKEVFEKVPERWEEEMRRVGNSEIGKENADWRIVTAEPYAKMEARVNEEWKLRMFAGTQTRIESYSLLKNGKLFLRHSPANYAESFATNNYDPWGLIRTYGGRNALADGHAVSVAITVMDKDKEVVQFFRRGKGLGEYGGYIGTAAGNSTTPDLMPAEIAFKEGGEEAKLLPFITAYGLSFKESGIMPSNESMKHYGRLGLAMSEFEVVEYIASGMKVRFADRKGKEAYGVLLYPHAPFLMTGMVTNVDPDDKDAEGKNKPHHKTEYLFLLRTGVQRKDADDPKYGWVRNDEHADVIYADMEQLPRFVLEHFTEMMPPTSGVSMALIKQWHGQQIFEKTLKDINSAHPIGKDHPLLQAVEEGSYTLHELLLQ